MSARIRSIGIHVAAVGLLVAVAALLIVLAGGSPGIVWARVFRELVLSPYGWAQALFRATPLVFAGLAVAVPLRAGLFNIGAEGQLLVGSFAAAVVGLAVSFLPGPFVALLAALAAFVGGGLWGGIAGELKRRFGAHEVISTIMLNFIAAAITSYFVVYHLAMPETIRTAELPKGAWLPRLSDGWSAVRGSSLNAAILVAIATTAVAAVLLHRSRFGFRLRAVGLGPRSAEANGIDIGAVQLRALMLGGALAGLVGVNEVLGYRHYFLANFSNGLGFMGIVVALLGGGRPAGVLLAALLIGWMRAAGLVINDLVPREIVDVLQAVVILVVLGVGALRRRFVDTALPAPEGNGGPGV